jgi:C1A family cysteine protease
MNEQKQDFMPSRLFVYYDEREIEGTIDSDSGTQIRNGSVVGGHAVLAVEYDDSQSRFIVRNSW